VPFFTKYVFSIPSGIITLTLPVIVPVSSITAFLPFDNAPFVNVRVAPVVALRATVC
jgi:hypothetical protein